MIPTHASTLPRAFQPNETWVDSRVDNCTEYRCQDESGVHMLVPGPVTCRDVSSCRVCAPGDSLATTSLATFLPCPEAPPTRQTMPTGRPRPLGGPAPGARAVSPARPLSPAAGHPQEDWLLLLL